jgi:hypothetical protein
MSRNQEKIVVGLTVVVTVAVLAFCIGFILG